VGIVPKDGAYGIEVVVVSLDSALP